MAKAFDIGKGIIKIYKKEEISNNKNLDKVFILDGSEMLPEDYFMYIILVREKLVWIMYQEVKAIFK